ncbi:hypothetical protein [Hominenteromicrobium sp.]|jgi:hypothetical protein|uniref:hypothetical protein n=1 Tax=Hominenteromicrobium sp. TaxID=3073581 RepID=UPI00206F58F7|nr:MAG TPA: hypothetical protein [Bacteriophage sp.]
MAWSQTAPELPSGSAWEQEKSVSGAANHWSLSGKLYIARLNGRQFAVKAELTSGNGSYGTYYPPEKWKLRCDIGSVTGTEDTSFGVSKGTTTFYFVGEAGEGVTITANVGGVDIPVATQTATFAAPALLGSTLYFKVGGTWKQATLYRKGGTWKNALAEFKAGGTWK